jgi:hypothetical protein
METDKFQELVSEVLERLAQENTEIRQTTNQLSERIDNIESILLRIDNNLEQKFQALLEAQQVQIEINQRICDGLSQNGKKEDAPSKGLFS